MKTLIIDAASIGGMEQVHERFYAAFDFPEYYGENFDALHDMLCELHGEAVIRITNNKSLERSIGGPEAKTLRRVLCGCAEENPGISVEFID